MRLEGQNPSYRLNGYLSHNQVLCDSRLRLVIHSMALSHTQVPARGKHIRGRLREELADKGLIFLLS
jgi:hypothetical protein